MCYIIATQVIRYSSYRNTAIKEAQVVFCSLLLFYLLGGGEDGGLHTHL